MIILSFLISIGSHAQPGSAIGGHLFFSLCDLKVQTKEYNQTYHGNGEYALSCFEVKNNKPLEEELIIFGGESLYVKIFSNDLPEGKLDYRLMIVSKNDSMIIDFKNLWYPYIEYQVKCIDFKKGYFIAEAEHSSKQRISGPDLRMKKPKLIEIKKVR